METPLLNTFVDLIKQSIPLIISTSNVSLNYAIIGFIIAMVNYVIYLFNKESMFDKFKYSVMDKPLLINKLNEGYFIERFSKIPLMTGVLTKNSPLEYKLKYFLTKYFQYKVKTYILSIDSKEDIITPNAGELQSFTSFIEEDKCFPLFYCKGKLLGIGRNKNISFLCYENNEVYNDFITYIDNYPVPQQVEVEKITHNEIEFHSANPLQIKYKLYPDRTLENTVTKFKPMITEYLDAFIEADKSGISRFNGFGSYNLGIMLYGAPGCGKTTIIRDVANYLNRTAKIINMRNIKTANDFQKIFYGSTHSPDVNYYQKYVYVLEEIDCIDSVLSRTEKKTDIDEKSIITELNSKHMQLLGMLNKDNESTLKPQIEKAEQDIKNHHERLSLDTLLTVLDGMIEMRGRVIVATTNFIDKIDDALVREGRFDIKIKLEKFTCEEIRELLKKMYRPDNEDIINNTVFPDGKWSPARIRNICHKYKKTEIEKVIADLLNIE